MGLAGLVRERARKNARHPRRTYVLLALAVALLLSYAAGMAIATRLLMGGSGSIVLPNVYSMLYNGSTGSSLYSLGLAESNDSGVTWTAHAGNPVLTVGAGGTWDDTWVAQCSLVWDGTQWVVYYSGSDGTDRRIGRATSPDLITWTKEATNPVLSLGSGGSFDDSSVNFPTVLYDPTAVHTWQMWYTGWPDGTALNTTIGYAHSADGISWTKVGKVLDVGSSGQFDDGGLATGPVVRVGSLYYLHYAGYDGAFYHSGYATTTDPEDDAAYTKQGVLSGYSGTLSVDGFTWHSNQVRSIVRRGSGYLAYISLFHPAGIPGEEGMGYVPATGPATLTGIPADLLIPLGSGWDSFSAENPSVVVRP
jgi:hypothetical protein